MSGQDDLARRIVAESRSNQGLPPSVADPIAVERAAGLLRCAALEKAA